MSKKIKVAFFGTCKWPPLKKNTPQYWWSKAGEAWARGNEAKAHALEAKAMKVFVATGCTNASFMGRVWVRGGIEQCSKSKEFAIHVPYKRVPSLLRTLVVR